MTANGEGALKYSERIGFTYTMGAEVPSIFLKTVRKIEGASARRVGVTMTCTNDSFLFFHHVKKVVNMVLTPQRINEK